jgi:uncharacterized BrkB/YihY/UPF0761 family membrane protein
MHNIIRFLIGLVVALGIILAIGTVLFFVWPVILGASILFLVLWGIFGVLFLVIGFFVLIWYLSREEPKKKDNKNYSIAKGKSR